MRLKRSARTKQQRRRWPNCERQRSSKVEAWRVVAAGVIPVIRSLEAENSQRLILFRAVPQRLEIERDQKELNSAQNQRKFTTPDGGYKQLTIKLFGSGV